MLRVAAALGAAVCTAASNPDAAALVQSAVRVHRDVGDGIAGSGHVLETSLQPRGTHDELDGTLTYEAGEGCHWGSTSAEECTMAWGDRVNLGSFYMRLKHGLRAEDKLGFHSVFAPDPLDEGSIFYRQFPGGIAPITVDVVCEFCGGECKMEVASETFGQLNATRPTTAKGDELCWDDRIKIGITNVVALPNWGFTLPANLGATIESITGNVQMEVNIIRQGGTRAAFTAFPKKRFGPRGPPPAKTTHKESGKANPFNPFPWKWQGQNPKAEEEEAEEPPNPNPNKWPNANYQDKGELMSEVKNLREPGGPFALAEAFFQKVGKAAELEKFRKPVSEGPGEYGDYVFTTGANVEINEIEKTFVRAKTPTRKMVARGINPPGAHYSLSVDSERCRTQTHLKKGSFRCTFPLGEASPAKAELHLEANLEPGAIIWVALEEPQATGLLGLTLKNWFKTIETKSWSFPVCGPAHTLKIGSSKVTLPELPCGHYSLDMSSARDVMMFTHADWKNLYFPGGVKMPELASYLPWKAAARVELHYNNETVYKAHYSAGFERT